MNIAELSIKRPIFIACIVILMVVTGIIGLNRLNIDLFPAVDMPVLTVTTLYPGATPEEIERLISKPLEEQINVISGLKKLTSHNMDGVSVVVAEFTLETDFRYAEEKMREKVMLGRGKLPGDLPEEPVVRQFDPITNVPIVTYAVMADMPPTGIYDLAKEKIKPVLEQGQGIGEVRIIGGTRREIQVELDLNKLNLYEISATDVAGQLRNSGANVPVGKHDREKTTMLFRTIGEFKNIEQIKNTAITFSGDVFNTVTLDKLGAVRDGSADPKTISSIYYPVEDSVSAGEKSSLKKRENRPCILIDIYKQSGTNTVAVADSIKRQTEKVNRILKDSPGRPRLVQVHDSSVEIRDNITDVKETMVMAIILTVIIVYLFLGNMRSTIITGIAIPNSLLGAFVLMYFMGFSINIMTLMALSLTIGLLVDDAIVVRENIFRKLESGMTPRRAAVAGTSEVMLAVIATTLVIIAVFLPIGFLKGLVGRFFLQFGLTVVFAMAISLFDALTVAPLLSAYFARSGGKANNILVASFERFQTLLDRGYSRVVSFSINHPLVIIAVTLSVLIASGAAFMNVKKTFLGDTGENQHLINLEALPGTNLKTTYATAKEIASRIQEMQGIDYITVQAGSEEGEYNIASLGVFFMPKKQREKSNTELKEDIRAILKDYPDMKSSIDYYTRVSGGMDKPFILQIKGDDLDELLSYSGRAIERIRKIPDLVEVSSSHDMGKPEFRIMLDENMMKMLGVTHKTAGAELRYLIEGDVVGKLRDKGLEYDVLMRLRAGQRDLERNYKQTRVPNMHMKLIPLADIAKGERHITPSKILRQNRTRIVQITANLSADGAVGAAIDKTRDILHKELPLPPGITYSFEGDASMFEEAVDNILLAFFLSVVFIYLVLASLYESFITPFAIFLALPPALSGAFFSLFITGKQLDLMGMIGLVMLLGLVSKNSIILVDFAVEGVHSGASRKEAIMKAGLLRLRPILMTTFSTIVGMLPLALGVGSASKYRVSMSVALIGGMIISTLITLIAVPAMFEYIDIFREFIEKKFRGKEEF